MDSRPDRLRHALAAKDSRVLKGVRERADMPLRPERDSGRIPLAGVPKFGAHPIHNVRIDRDDASHIIGLRVNHFNYGLAGDGRFVSSIRRRWGTCHRNPSCGNALELTRGGRSASARITSVTGWPAVGASVAENESRG